MNKMNISLNLSDEQRKTVFKRLLQSKGLLFLVFWGILLIYSFYVVYNKAYIEVNFLDYKDNSNFIGTYRESVTLEKIMQNIREKEVNLKNNKAKIYKDPFVFTKENMDKNIEEGQTQEADGSRDIARTAF